MTSPASAPPIVLVHGLWLTPRSWEGLEGALRDRGHQVLAPAWPRMVGEVEDLRCDPSPLNGLGVTEIVDHYDGSPAGSTARP
jgi:pimeloyl-ACP methyl ester carboxylesterase